MKVYKHGSKEQNHTVFVTPAIDCTDVVEWKEDDGREKMFEVKFINGVAEVPKNLGKYLIDYGQAKGSKIITDINL